MEIKNLDTAPKAEAPKAAQAAPVAATPTTITVPAKDGRTFVLKKMKPSARFLLAETVETKTPSGEMQAIVVASVFQIDDEVLTPLADKAEMLQRLDEIGDEGLAAITGPVLTMYGVNLTDKDVKAAKNS